MTEIAKFLAGFSANQVLTHGAFVWGSVQFTLFGIHSTTRPEHRGNSRLGRSTGTLLVVRLDQDAAVRMNRRKRDERSSSPGAGDALERELDQALAATFPASDPVAVDSAEQHRARLRRKPRGRAARSPRKGK